MLRNPSRTTLLAFLVALTALYISQPSHAAPEPCLAAPNSAAPAGQHWYYHSDRATGRKCWFLREIIAKPAAAATAPSAGAAKTSAEAASPTKPAASSQPPRDTSTRPSDTSKVGSNVPHANDGAPASAVPAQAEMESAEPFEPTSEPIVAATPWPAPQPAPASIQKSDATPSGATPAAISNTTDLRVAAKQEAIVPDNPKPVTAAAYDNPSISSVGQDLLIIALAAALAGAMSVAIAVFRRRKPVTAKLAHFIALTEALTATVFAKPSMLPRRKSAKSDPADFSPRFGSRPNRQGIGKLTLQNRKAEPPQSAPIQTALVPEQLTMARPFVAPRRLERANQDRRARVE